MSRCFHKLDYPTQFKDSSDLAYPTDGPTTVEDFKTLQSQFRYMREFLGMVVQRDNTLASLCKLIIPKVVSIILKLLLKTPLDSQAHSYFSPTLQGI
jgi:hypothetical protein